MARGCTSFRPPWVTLRRLVAALLLAAAAPSGVKAQALPRHPLGDIQIGANVGAPTIVLYLSYKCLHCRNFIKHTLAELRAKHVARGQLNILVRELPVDDADFAAAMLVRCVPRAQYWDMADRIQERFDNLDPRASVRDELRQAAAAFGMSAETFEGCLRDRAVFDGLKEGRSAAAQAGITAAPTIIAGGRRHGGAATLAQIERMAQLKP